MENNTIKAVNTDSLLGTGTNRKTEEELVKKLVIWRNSNSESFTSIVDFLIRKHVQEKESVKKIAEEIGIGQKVLKKAFKRCNIPYRTRKEATENFWTQEKRNGQANIFRKKRNTRKFIENYREHMRNYWNNPENCKTRSEIVKNQWEHREFRQKYYSAIMDNRKRRNNEKRRINEQENPPQKNRETAPLQRCFRNAQRQQTNARRRKLVNEVKLNRHPQKTKFQKTRIPVYRKNEDTNQDIGKNMDSIIESNIEKAIAYSNRSYTKEGAIKIFIRGKEKNKLMKSYFVTVDNRGNKVAYHIVMGKSEITNRLYDTIRKQQRIRTVVIDNRFYQKLQRRLEEKIDGWEN